MIDSLYLLTPTTSARAVKTAITSSATSAASEEALVAMAWGGASVKFTRYC
jgi:hypothetical protein